MMPRRQGRAACGYTHTGRSSGQKRQPRLRQTMFMFEANGGDGRANGLSVAFQKVHACSCARAIIARGVKLDRWQWSPGAFGARRGGLRALGVKMVGRCARGLVRRMRAWGDTAALVTRVLAAADQRQESASPAPTPAWPVPAATMEKARIPTYEEAIQGYGASRPGLSPASSMSLQIANVQRDRVHAAAETHIREALESHVESGLSRMIYALVPSDRDPLNESDASPAPDILEKTGSASRGYFVDAPTEEIVSFGDEDYVRVVRLHGPENSARFWQQPPVIKLLEARMRQLLGLEELPPARPPVVESSPMPRTKKEQREFERARSIGTLGKAIGWRSNRATDVLGPGDIDVRVAIEELAIRRMTEVGLYETRMGTAVVVRSVELSDKLINANDLFKLLGKKGTTFCLLLLELSRLSKLLGQLLSLLLPLHLGINTFGLGHRCRGWLSFGLLLLLWHGFWFGGLFFRSHKLGTRYTSFAAILPRLGRPVLVDLNVLWWAVPGPNAYFFPHRSICPGRRWDMTITGRISRDTGLALPRCRVRRCAVIRAKQPSQNDKARARGHLKICQRVCSMQGLRGEQRRQKDWSLPPELALPAELPKRDSPRQREIVHHHHHHHILLPLFAREPRFTGRSEDMPSASSSSPAPSSAPPADRSRSPKRRRLDNGYEPTDARDSKNPLSRSPSLPTLSTPQRQTASSAVDGNYESADDLPTPTPTHHRQFLAPHITSNGARSPDDYGSSPIHTPVAPGAEVPFLQPNPTEETLHYSTTHILHGHRLAISAIKFSPNGTRLATCSSDATAKIWSFPLPAKGQPTTTHDLGDTDFCLLHTLKGHLAGLSTLAWAPDSSILATGSDDKTIRLWNAATGRPYPAALRGHHNAVYSLAFSPKGNMLVSGSVDEAVFLWDVRAARLMRSLPAHSDPVTSVDFVRDGTLVASCSSDGLIRIWDTATGQCLRTIFHEDKPLVTGLRFSPNGRFLATWMLDSSIRLWDYVQGRCVKTYKGHKNIKYSLDGAFGTYGGDNTLESDEGAEDGSAELRVDPERHHAFIASGSEDGSLIIWDVVSKAVLQVMKGHDGIVFGVDVHPTERMLASCGKDKTIRIWQEKAEAGVRSFNAGRSPANDSNTADETMADV
ncbi:hypothetical protein FH972_023130 [Carpinus fangiana]|uniref:WDR5-like beta-propeller domain-containing protein n=1 Tax=Carpinus fangiana TaxID=176857 RepID=A0A5N6KUA2_9ROSI|nr:hypothetical protein FH972_023130 [Carpinus fangiana]